MVRTFAPSADNANMVQDFTALPSTWTTQAPHWDVSQPTWVPVRRRFSRRYWTSSVRVSTSAVTGLPFTVMETVGMMAPPHNYGPKGPFFQANGSSRDGKGRNRIVFARMCIGMGANLTRGAGRGQGNWLRRGRVPEAPLAASWGRSWKLSARPCGRIGHAPQLGHREASRARRCHSRSRRDRALPLWLDQIGRASGRGRGEISVVAG